MCAESDFSKSIFKTHNKIYPHYWWFVSNTVTTSSVCTKQWSLIFASRDIKTQVVPFLNSVRGVLPVLWLSNVIVSVSVSPSAVSTF